MRVLRGAIFFQRLGEALASLRHPLHRPPIRELAGDSLHHQRLALHFDDDLSSRLQIQTVPDLFRNRNLPLRRDRCCHHTTQSYLFPFSPPTNYNRKTYWRSLLTLQSCLTAVFTLTTAAFAQTGGGRGEINAETKARLEKAPKFVEMFMPMRDTVVLAANVYLPPGNGPFPAILLRTPYIKDNPREPLAAQKYVEAGYAYVDQDTRGKGHSKGVYHAFTTDIEDGYDTIEWIAKQPWSNGKVGIMGTSALGITSNLAAMSGAPHLTAAYVTVAPYEHMKNTYPGGVLKDADTIGWTRGQGGDQAVLDAISGNARDSRDWAKNSVMTNLKYVHIPIWHNGGWYDIFNDGNRWFQN